MPKIVSIAGARSNIGKTTLIEELLRRLEGGWAVCKVTVCHDHPEHACPHGKLEVCGVCIEEVDGFFIEENDSVLKREGKDTWRYYQAGAEAVRWIRAEEHHVAAAVHRVIDQLDEYSGILFEGNRALSVLKPDLGVMVTGKPPLYKKSAREILSRADMICSFDTPGSIAGSSHLAAIIGRITG